MKSHKAFILSLISVLALFSALAQSNPLDLSNSESDTYKEVWKNANLQDVEAWLETGVDLIQKDGNGMTALMWAAGHTEDLEILSRLIEAGADVNTSDELGFTPLLYSISAEGTEKLRFFLNEGADVNLTGLLGLTPLIIAASVDNLEAVTILLSAGADVNAKYPLSGMTALMVAASKTTHPEMIKVLLAANADAMMTDKDGKGAIDYAKENPALTNTDVYRVLASLSGTAEERAFDMGDMQTGELKAPFAEVIKLEVAPDLPRGTVHEFEISVTGDLQGFFTVKDPEGEEVYAQYVFPNAPLKFDREFRMGGTYTLRLVADKGEGTFTMSSTPLVITESSDGFQGMITLGTEVSGTIASSYDLPIYHIEATEGVPIAFRITSNPETNFTMTAQPVGLDYGSLGVRPDEKGRLIFAPEMTMTYELMLHDEGANTPISYTIVAEVLEGFDQGSETTLIEDSPVTGELTTSITHVYEFEGAPPSPDGARGVRISATSTTPLSYSVHVSGRAEPLNELRGTIAPGESTTIRMTGSGSMGAMIGRETFVLEEGTFEVRISSNAAASYEVALERVP